MCLWICQAYHSYTYRIILLLISIFYYINKYEEIKSLYNKMKYTSMV